MVDHLFGGTLGVAALARSCFETSPATSSRRRSWSHRLSVGVLMLGLTTPAWAHHPGGAGNSGAAGPVGTLPATTLDEGQVAAFVLYEVVRLKELSDQVLIEAAGRHEHVHSLGTIQSTSIGAAFGLTHDLTVSVRLPFVTRTDIREGTHSHLHGGGVLNSVTGRGDTFGVGDMTVLGQWRFFNNPAIGTELAVLGGIKVPTGKTNERDHAGELFEAEFQPGSGSTDAFAGLALTQRIGAWSFNANVLYQFVNKGVQDTNLGDRFFYNAAVGFRLLGGPVQTSGFGASTPAAYAHAGHSHAPASGSRFHRHAHGTLHDPGPEAAPVLQVPQLAIDAVCELNGEWHDKQVEAGVKDPNSGGNVVYLSPGIRISRANLSGFASVGIPVVNDLNGIQAKSSYRVLTGFAISF